MTRLLTIALASPCHYCGANPGEHCRSKPSGKRATYMHEARIRPVANAYREGYDTGENDILCAAFNSRPYFDRRLEQHRDRCKR